MPAIPKGLKARLKPTKEAAAEQAVIGKIRQVAQAVGVHARDLIELLPIKRGRTAEEAKRCGLAAKDVTISRCARVDLAAAEEWETVRNKWFPYPASDGRWTNQPPPKPEPAVMPTEVKQRLRAASDVKKVERKEFRELNGLPPIGRYAVHGHPVTTVLRWMGKAGFGVEQALKALAAHKVAPSKSTVSIQLRAGKTGERGEPAALTKEQAKDLMRFKKETSVQR